MGSSAFAYFGEVALSIKINQYNAYMCAYLSMLCFESLLHTPSPLLEALLQKLPSKASTLVPPTTSWRRRPLIHRVVSCHAAGHFAGAVTSRIRSVKAGGQTHTQLV